MKKSCLSTISNIMKPTITSILVGLLSLRHIDAFSPIISSCSTTLVSHPLSAIPNRRREFITTSIITTAGIFLPTFTQIKPALADDDTISIDPSITLPKITNKVYLDIKFPKYKEPKRLVVGLFGDDAPKVVDNFVKLCTNSDDVGPSYAGSSFYRALSGMSIQGGDVGDSSGSGKSGTSAFEDGKSFTPDNYNIKHTKAGLLSMVRTKTGDVDSRFFIQTEEDAGWADNRYAVFGIVLEEGGGDGESKDKGMDLVKRISKVDVKTPQNSPKEPITIVGCGLY